MTELQQKQLAFLEETVAFYNLGNRCVQGDGVTCRYHIDGKDGCAIGRRIADKELCKHLDKFENTGVLERRVYDLLPESLKELGQSFLSKVQQLHDTSFYWTKTGISATGEERVIEIKEMYGLL
jgi:hypothetical protein